jgi:aromatic ring-opening dioxygenase catalytic subunit (LigB family)
VIKKLPVLFVSHGGGPWPWIEEMRRQFQITEKELKSIGEQIKPKAILAISGHWEEPLFSVSTSLEPPMLYDYSGFPPHTYHLQYGAPGSIELAIRIKSLLASDGIHVHEDPKRGFDHGTFVPLHLMYPEANIPVVQLSLKSNLDPKEHIRIGELLKPLREENVLIIGSGLTYHNLRLFFSGGKVPSEGFEEWLTKAVEAQPLARKQLLVNWENAPYARLAHPREDHLLPLMVIVGAAGEDRGRRLFLDNAFDIAMASYQFG